MKKLLFAAAVITAMASCSNNEIIDVILEDFYNHFISKQF